MKGKSNAKKNTYNGIEFRSTMEMKVYKYLHLKGYEPEYEKYTFEIAEGFKPTAFRVFDKKNSKSNEIIEKKNKFSNVVYTPDISFYYKKQLIIIEVKGWKLGDFNLRFKMFRKAVEDNPGNFPQFTLFFIYKESDIEFMFKKLKEIEKEPEQQKIRVE